jgi:hypothetical protein
MRNILKKIGAFFVHVWTRFRWLIRKKRNRQYRVIRCPDMQSMVGMKCYGTPKINQMIIFTMNKGEGHRVHTPANIIKVGRGNMEIYTKYIYIFVKRIK